LGKIKWIETAFVFILIETRIITIMADFIKTSALLFVLLNPFLLIVYLVDMVEKFSLRDFSKILIRAGAISFVTFVIFAMFGDTLFSSIMQVHFASFQIFGGLIFLIIGVQFVFKGPGAIQSLRGESQHLAGNIAMPILIGPATISASILSGERLPAPYAVLSIATALTFSIVIMLLLKVLHDRVKPRKEPLINRYIEITGRITALYVGTFSIEMIMNGMQAWIANF